jgi:acyl-CoA synthetase (AMP-forming)/AMP-acid ligase II
MDLLHAHGLGDLLQEHRRSRPHRCALVCGEERISYAELDARVARLSAALRARGFAEGDRLLWLGQNCHRLLEGLLAAARLGVVFCPANWRQSPDELAFAIRDSAPRAVIWQEAEIGERVAQARKQAGGDALWIRHDATGEGSYEALLEDAPDAEPEPPVDPALPVLQLYTAAFDGQPRGALLSHTALLLQGLVVSKIQDVGPDTVYLNCGPLFHVATFMTTLATFVWGGTNVFTRRVDAAELCRLIDAERCNGAFIIGPTMQQVVEANADGRYDLSSLRSFRAFPQWNEMTSEDASPWGRRPGGYGQTEVTGLLTLAALGTDAKGSHGRPGPLVQVRILDPEGREVAPGEVGEIAARGPTVMEGYRGRDEENARRRAAGWHRTGDLGRRENDGSLSFIGPRTRLIKSAAENIYPIEVERCLASHPAVKECAVIGVPDPRWTQSVVAVAVLKPEAAATAQELIEHCRSQIASYKKPRRVEFADALPRKGFAVDYDALDERYGGGGYPGGGERPATEER